MVYCITRNIAKILNL